MAVEPALSARGIVRLYHSRGIPAKVCNEGILVHFEDGWVGPFGANNLQHDYLDEIDRIEGKARIAAVLAMSLKAVAMTKSDLVQEQLVFLRFS